ncbi:histone-lysine N-methyltransferase SMYD3 isoform X2 [Sitophilus oryzae]|uniref:Histone-lysine N-methyltransferase SMYD3 isoform X2 n=1 Tax=Sitophilus oryzae TaxID=7048 RepID=A0A6J2XXW5_SITOR|nr:histone-lysine N-methyltransferase SMYD3 isoform X2 [Sitophilus oryzae]
MSGEQGDIEAMHEKKVIVPQGTTIHQEKPFVYILSSKYRTECCDFCFKKSNDLAKCSSCKYVYYCGKICQRQGWGIHKQECKNLKKTLPRILPDAARLLYRLYKTLDNGGDTFRSYYTEKKYRVWRDLISHYPEIKRDKKRMEHLTSLYGVLYEFCDGEMLPNIAELTGFYGRMCVNSFNICNQELQSLGTGIYLGASIIDHSCQPNAVAVFEGTTIFIRTLETLPCLDWSKVRISYIDVLASTEERKNELKETYYFMCDCPKCLGPENMSEMYGAACQNRNCDNYIDVSEKICKKCDNVLSEDFVEHFRNIMEFSSMHLDSMRNTTYLDVCRVCLRKQEGVLYKYNLKHIKMLDLAFESSIDLEAFDIAAEYGLKLIECYHMYYPTVHPLTGLLHLKLCKLLLYQDKTKEGIVHLRKASDILKITHGNSSILYKTEVLPLIQQCRSMLKGINGFK